VKLKKRIYLEIGFGGLERLREERGPYFKAKVKFNFWGNFLGEVSKKG